LIDPINSPDKDRLDRLAYTYMLMLVVFSFNGKGLQIERMSGLTLILSCAWFKALLSGCGFLLYWKWDKIFFFFLNHRFITRGAEADRKWDKI